jgi:cyclopropane-fatty-acyl-phospholipid synthase
LLARTYRRQVLKLIESLDDARIEWHEAGEVRVLECAKPARFRFRIDILDPAFYRKVALGGSVGAGESYMDGDWRVDDLTQVIQTLVHNRDALDAMEGGLASLAVPVLKLFERMRRNTREGSKRNILAHYDLGDRLFSRFLDPTMMYSSAVFEHEDQTLDEAAVAKLDRICRKLDLGPGDHLLEIGTGWGGLAIHAARTTGCRVTTTTISDNQYAHAKQAVVAAGLDDRITVLDCDYRDLDGTYDKLVSVEMVEAVGHQFLDQYIQKCASLLKPDGLFLMQAILIEDHRYLQARDSVDFIKRHVFPGSFIPSVGAITESAARGTDLKLSHFEEFGDSYARTLQVWRERFLARWDELSSLGYSEEFRRLWEFYLCYCEGGFRERSISVGQFVYARPGDRRAAILPKSEVLR